MSVVKEFKEFAMKGNVVDLAVGVVIGAAFGKIVSSFVADLVMPPVGLLVGGDHFANLKLTLRAASHPAEKAVTLNYGAFLQNVLDFLLIAIVIFGVVKVINRLKRIGEAEAAPPPPPVISPEIVLLTEIRDALNRKA